MSLGKLHLPGLFRLRNRQVSRLVGECKPNGEAQMPNAPKDVWIRHALEEHQRVLFVVAATIAGREHAADVVQDAFLRLCEQEPDEVRNVRAPLDDEKRGLLKLAEEIVLELNAVGTRR